MNPTRPTTTGCPAARRVATGATLALLAACSGTTAAHTSSSQATAARTATTSPSGSTATSSPLDSTVTTPASPAATGTAASPLLPTTGAKATRSSAPQADVRVASLRCRTSQLSITLGRADGTAGSLYIPLVLRNTGSTMCLLRGYPGVSFVGDAGRQVGEAATRSGVVRLVRLAGGGVAHATLRVVDHFAYDPATCRPTAVRGFRVYPPGSTTSAFVSSPGTTCGSTSLTLLSVSAVAPRAS